MMSMPRWSGGECSNIRYGAGLGAVGLVIAILAVLLLAPKAEGATCTTSSDAIRYAFGSDELREVLVITSTCVEAPFESEIDDRTTDRLERILDESPGSDAAGRDEGVHGR